MAIIQAIQKIKTLYLYFIKNLSSLLSRILRIFFLTLLLFSCSSHLIEVEKIKPSELYCGSTMGQFMKSDKNFISKENDNFEKKIVKINPNFIKRDYNLIVVSGSKPTGGYSLKLKNIIKKNNTYHLNFYDIEPAKNSINFMAATYPFCLLKIENLNKFKVFIDNE
jgi:hypothetical protein